MLNFGNKEFRNLQEQVLKNAQDIETLKGRENLQIVIVEELPEEGNPNYIYLVPNEDEEESNVYNEYVWLADEEAYEKIGGVDIDLTNYVTLNTAQTIEANKTISKDNDLLFGTLTGSGTYFYISSKNSNNFHIGAVGIASSLFIDSYLVNLSPESDTQDLGKTSNRWRHLYINGNIDFGNNAIIHKDSSNRVVIQFGGNDKVKVGNAVTYFDTGLEPVTSNTYDLGSSTYCWKDAYIAGNISDGVNSVTVANISKKTTSTYASGTFDASGQDTIDISGGTPEGLFIFSYGNCQCLVHLTATNVQNADLTPIRVSCPMINNSNAKNGWLAISRSGTTLTIEVVDDDAQEHVDSGYAWTLVKTNLI